MHGKVLLLFSIMFLGASCAVKVSPPVPEIKSDYWMINKCARGVPSPTIDERIYPGSTFHLDTVNGIGTEKVRLGDDTTLTVVNKGCEYYALTYEFRIRRPDRNMSVKDWYHSGADLLAEIEPANLSAADLKLAAKRLKEYAGSGGTPKFGQQIELQKSSIKQYVDLEVLEDNGAATVKIDYVVGPLY